ncbi:MAG: hypothetical protein QOD06_1544 [Candidatus Binatota bacterium]|jgi:L-ascorbate metabolism protein UlaG (beta-lactamase superfamily)|nr:hypothetical protein [Candidatus Binatota bacterium]
MLRLRPRASVAVAPLLAILLAGCYAPKIALRRSYHPSDADLSVTRLVHGSVILDFHGTRILVDPWYSPTFPVGLGAEVGLALDKLPRMQAILITHRHSDHLDEDTLRSYRDKTVQVIVPPGLAGKLRGLGYRRVTELELWEQTLVGKTLVIAVPARHSVRENGYILQANKVTAYVAGDTRFDPKLFWSITEAFPKIDVALLPVGGIRYFGALLDMTPDEAARAFGILKPHRVIPYHYEMIGPLPMLIANGEAAADFVKSIERRFPGSSSAVIRLDPGESWHFYALGS